MLKFYLLTLGCQMNKNDSERIVGLLLSFGYAQMDNPEGADLLIINTCSVRQSAEDRVFGFIKNWQKLREKKPDLIIAITGCMPGRDKDGKTRKKIKGADLFFGIDELPMLPGWLSGLGGGTACHSEAYGRGISAGNSSGDPSLDARDDSAYLDITPARDSNFKSSVTIQTGCNNFCTYCVVPYARGREKNRLLKDILSEVKEAVRGGPHSAEASRGKTKEITLLGQTVNSYKILDKENIDATNPFAGKDDFVALLWEINRVQGDFRIHFTAADPQYFNDYHIEALKFPKQVNYLHLPAQSGDNEILKKMNRKYTREKYLEIVKKIRAARPDIALGTDLIVGFPGETEEQFQNTLNLYKQCDFDISYHAKYSERSGTAAAKAFKDDVPKEIKKQRWEALQSLMEETTWRKNQKYTSRTVSVLVENYKDSICSGNSSEMKLVYFLGGPELVGRTVNVTIKQADTWLLRGTLSDRYL